jgi:hypothetical protein
MPIPSARRVAANRMPSYNLTIASVALRLRRRRRKRDQARRIMCAGPDNSM